MKEPGQASIRKAVAFLQSHQQSDGSFLSYSSPQPYAFTNTLTYKTTLANSAILYCLSSAKIPQTQSISNKLVDYLATQAGPRGTYNYWDTTSPEYTNLPYPDDLDDTFYALSSLSAFSAHRIHGAALAQATVALLLSETRPGGPYKTWLTDDTRPAWNDVDVVVNANIKHFMDMHAISHPGLQQYLSEVIATNRFHSPYYPSQFHVLYFVSRAAEPANFELICSFAERLAKVNPPRSALERALLIHTFISVGRYEKCAIYLSRLTTEQQNDGSWPASALCVDPKRRGYKHFNGGSSITTAFAISALSAKNSLPPPGISASSGVSLHIKAAHEIARSQIKTLEETVQKPLLEQLQYCIQGSNAEEILVSVVLFDHSLPTSQRLPKDTLYALGVANLFGWVAYTIYDNLIDDEGEIGLLPIANIAQRRALIGFSKINNQDQQFQEYVEHTFNRIDNANAWELKYCRAHISEGKILVDELPDFGDRIRLAEKSIGHALPLLGVAVLRGSKVHSDQFHHLEEAISHYLIARQLHDDIHDWQEDLVHGHISFVIATLLRHQSISGLHDIVALTTQLQQPYWRQVVPMLCGVVEEHLSQAQKKLADSDYTQSSLIDTINKLRNVTEDTLRKQKDTLLFLDTYAALTKNRH
jgi:hypothetical protein